MERTLNYITEMNENECCWLTWSFFGCFSLNNFLKGFLNPSVAVTPSHPICRFVSMNSNFQFIFLTISGKTRLRESK